MPQTTTGNCEVNFRDYKERGILFRMNDIRVGVVRGGTGPEYHVSLASGARVLANLPEGYKPVDIWISKDGLWHVKGVPVRPEDAIRQADVIFSALHETDRRGEHDDPIRLAHNYHMPHVGPDAFASSIAANKVLSRDYFRKHDIKIPRGRVLRGPAEVEQVAFEVFNLYSPPWVVKPSRGGSSFGVTLVYTYPELIRAIEEALKHDDTVLIEEFIDGKEITCCVIEADGLAKSFPPLEIEKPPHKKIFDHALKYETGDYRLRLDSLEGVERHKVEETALRAHASLGLSGYSRTDFIMTPHGHLYVLETNARPALSPLALFPKALEAIAVPFPEFIEHILVLARRLR